MGVIAFAFSVHNFISKVGADAGFAAIIGLALLVFLYFAQAREIASVRHRSDEAAEHVQYLEARVAQLTRSQPAAPAVAPPPTPAPAGIRPATASSVAAASVGAGPIIASRNPAAAGRGQAIPAPPAGVAAPALTAATRLIPAPAASVAPMMQAAPVAQAGPVAQGTPAAPAAVPEPVGAVSGRTDSAVAVGGPPPAAAVGPPPATAAGGANGAAQARAPRPSAAGTLPPPPPRIQIRPSGSGTGGRAGAPPPRRQRVRGERPRGGRGFLIALGLLGAVAVAAVLLILTSNGGTNTATTASVRTSNAPKTNHRTHRAAFNPSSVTVAVLNGTATNGLAGRVSARLAAAGYKKGAVATAPDQTHTATIVAYLTGDKRDALAVAGALKLGSASVQPVDPTNQAVACPPSAKCAANVVVVVGSDLASTP